MSLPEHPSLHTSLVTKLVLFAKWTRHEVFKQNEYVGFPVFECNFTHIDAMHLTNHSEV